MTKAISSASRYRCAPQINCLGFTLLEICIVVLVTGVLLAIAAPAWLYFTRVTTLNTAQERVLQAMQNARQNARFNRVIWEFVIRQTPESQVQWAIQPYQSKPVPPVWHNLDSHIRLDPETSLKLVKGVHRIQFNYLGTVNGQLGRVTLSIKGGGKMQRCVVVATLLGALRAGTDRPQLMDGKRCW